MQKLSFNMTFLEDLERDRTELRVLHILQFYSIPKIEKITKRGKVIEQLVYRDIQLNDVKLADGKTGNRIIKLTNNEVAKNPDERKKMADQLSVDESIGELAGVPTQADAVSVDIFDDYNLEFQVVKYSSYEKNQALDQASKMELANWRFSIAQLAPIGDVSALVKWVEEAFDAPSEDWENTMQAPGMAQQGGIPGAPPQGGTGQPAGPSGQPQVMKQMAPSNMRESAINQNA